MKLGSRISDGLRRTAWAACLALAAFTLFCVFFRAHGISRKEFDYSNAVYMICAFVFASCAYVLMRGWNGIRHDKRWIALGCGILFVFQRFITHQVIFGTGWDAVDIVNFAWRIATGGECTDWENLYLSCSPNNILMILLYSVIIRIRMLFGADLVRRDVLLALTLVNSLIAAATGYLVYCLTRRIAAEKRTALFAWLLYCALVGLSPWFLIPYSDSLSLGIPLLILFIYFSDREKAANWILIGALSYLGYRLKPSVFVVLVAIVIWEILAFLKCRKGEAKRYCGKAGVLLLSVVVVHAGFSAIPHERFGWDINEEGERGVAHFLMMGLNTVNIGGYLDEDVAFSSSIASMEERTRENLRVAAERLKEMGPAGYMSFLADKNAVNFHDGTFAWGKEGGFMRVIFDVEETRPIRILRSVFYPDGDRHHHLMNVLQMFWMGALLGHAFALLDRRACKKELLVMHLCIAGIALFTLLFESRARYLYVFVPIIIVAASLGYESAAKRIGKLTARNKGPKGL